VVVVVVVVVVTAAAPLAPRTSWPRSCDAASCVSAGSRSLNFTFGPLQGSEGLASVGGRLNAQRPTARPPNTSTRLQELLTGRAEVRITTTHGSFLVLRAHEAVVCL
jgi:hypothetical protein